MPAYIFKGIAKQLFGIASSFQVIHNYGACRVNVIRSRPCMYDEALDLNLLTDYLHMIELLVIIVERSSRFNDI